MIEVAFVLFMLLGLIAWDLDAMARDRDEERAEGSWLVAVAIAVLLSPVAVIWCGLEWLREWLAKRKARR